MLHFGLAKFLMEMVSMETSPRGVKDQLQGDGIGKRPLDPAELTQCCHDQDQY